MKLDWTKGYTPSELEQIQSRFELRFPPDLIELYLDRRPVQGHDWLGPRDVIRSMLERPLEGLLFDVRNNELWHKRWGPRPASLVERENKLRELVRQAPRLIPVYSHRFIPETPSERGNPVLSVHQSDLIYYGADLADYWIREERTGDPPWPAIKRIPFWSDLIEDDR